MRSQVESYGGNGGGAFLGLVREKSARFAGSCRSWSSGNLIKLILFFHFHFIVFISNNCASAQNTPYTSWPDICQEHCRGKGKLCTFWLLARVTTPKDSKGIQRSFGARCFPFLSYTIWVVFMFMSIIFTHVYLCHILSMGLQPFCFKSSFSQKPWVESRV